MSYTPIALCSKFPGIWHSSILYYHPSGKNLKEIYHSYEVSQIQICDAHGSCAVTNSIIAYLPPYTKASWICNHATEHISENFLSVNPVYLQGNSHARTKAKHFIIQVRAAEDRKKIALLLSVSHMTEHDIVYLSSFPQHRVDHSKFIHGVRNVKGKFIICFQNK
jgi:hypothetical protein